MQKLLFYIFFIFAFTIRPLFSQDIGLSVDDRAYLTLDFLEGSRQTEARYAGHVTTYDIARGFIHSGVAGKITAGSELQLQTTSLRRFEGLAADYQRQSVDRNTTWVRKTPCIGECVNSLKGTTWQSDRKANELLDYYEINREARAQPIRTFVSYSNARSTLCGMKISKFCTNHDKVGVLMEQSQVGAAKVVAKALGLEAEVATFAVPSFNGALVASSPSLVSAVFKSIGPELNDGVLDVNGWQVVNSLIEDDADIHLLQLSIGANSRFFDTMQSSPNALEQINIEMAEFFPLVSGSQSNCNYETRNSVPVFRCYIHSTKLGLTGQGAWISVTSFMTPYVLDEQTLVVVHLYYQIKYGKASLQPSGQFVGIKYRNSDEALFAKFATRRVANSFQKFFEPNIQIVR